MCGHPLQTPNKAHVVMMMMMKAHVVTLEIELLRLEGVT